MRQGQGGLIIQACTVNFSSTIIFKTSVCASSRFVHFITNSVMSQTATYSTKYGTCKDNWLVPVCNDQLVQLLTFIQVCMKVDPTLKSKTVVS